MRLQQPAGGGINGSRMERSGNKPHRGFHTYDKAKIFNELLTYLIVSIV